MVALLSWLVCIASLLTAAEEHDVWSRTLQASAAISRGAGGGNKANVAKLAERMRKQEMVAALGISQEVAAMNYDLRWGNEWFLMNDVKRKGTNIYVFGAFWDVRARQFNLRYGYWTQGYELYLNNTAKAEAEKKAQASGSAVTSSSTKINMNPYNQTLVGEMKMMYFKLNSQGYSRDDISEMLRGNFSAALEQDRLQQLTAKEEAIRLREAVAHDEKENAQKGTGDLEGGTSSASSAAASTIQLGPPPSSSSGKKGEAWDPDADRFISRGGSTLSINEAKDIEGLSDIQMKKLFRKDQLRQRKKNVMRAGDSFIHSVHDGSGSGSGSGRRRRLQGKSAPTAAKPKLSKLPTGIGDALYVRVYMVAHKKLIGPGTMRPGLVDYRVGTCEFHYRSGKITEGRYYLQMQSRELNKPGKMLAAAYAVCHLDGFTGGEYPEGVALQPLNYKGEKQIMMIRGNRRVIQNLGTKYARKKKFLAVCVRPIFRAYRDYQQMANFLLYYSQVGVSHFVIYNSGVASPRLMGLLDVAKRANVSLEMRNWNIQDDLAYENMQNMNIEVCLHSLMGFYKYVAVVDLDELLVPMKVPSLPQLINTLTKDTPKMIDKPHGLIFKTAFFCKTNSPRITYPGYKSNGDKLMILRDLVRTPVIETVRYKYIIRPESIYESSVHFPFVSPRIYMRQTTQSVKYINEEDALVHHYRDIELDMNDVKEDKNCSVMDTSMFRYANDLKNMEFYKLLANEGYWQPAERQTNIQIPRQESFDGSLQGSGSIISAYDKALYLDKLRKRKQQIEEEREKASLKNLTADGN